MRVVICGWPGSGKSELAKELGSKMGVTPMATDSISRTMDWSSASETISHWFDKEGPWIIEGVAVPRALRKWLARNTKGTTLPDVPFDRLFVLPHPNEEVRLKMKPGQITMGRGHDTVLRELNPWLDSYL